MEVKALTKHVRMSPKKMREVSRLIQGLPAEEALDKLQFIPRKSARLIRKTLNSAIANAENNHGLSAEDLVVKSIVIEEGPVLRRFIPVARGSAHPIRKRTSHIRIILEDEV